MRSTKRWLTAGALFGALLLLAYSAEDKHLAVYTPSLTYRIAVADVDGREYVSLFDLLSPLGATNIRQEGKEIYLHFIASENHFTEGGTTALIGQSVADLGGPTLVRDGKVLVPLRAAPDVITHLLGGTTEFHRDSRRLFVGGAGVHYSAEFQKAAEPQLALKFSAPVNPSISTEHGLLRMTFTRDAVLSATPKVSFDDKIITAAEFSESDGSAQLTVRGNAPLLASFSDGGKTITITPAPAGTVVSPPTPTPPAPGTETTPSTNTAQLPTPPSPGGETPATPGPNVPRGRNLIIIDPSHGGNDPGARLTDKIAEKDVTLALAYHLRAELERRGYGAVILRESDATLSFEQRATIVDAARPSLYIALHAGGLGSGVHVYTSLPTPQPPSAAGAFLPWDTAQSAFATSSRALADAIVQVASKKDLAVLEMPSPVRPLNNIAAPAVAIEMAPRGNIQDLTNSSYQQQVAAAVADGVVAYRNKLEVHP